MKVKVSDGPKLCGRAWDHMYGLMVTPSAFVRGIRLKVCKITSEYVLYLYIYPAPCKHPECHVAWRQAVGVGQGPSSSPRNPMLAAEPPARD